MYAEIVESYKNVFGQLNKETREHCLSVGELCERCADSLSIDHKLAFRIGLLHDVGKIYIPSRILKKNKSLTETEREVVDLHAYFGYRLLKGNGESPSVYLPVLFHHGYTKYRLSEPDEPLTEQYVRYTSLIHAVDIFDAMNRKRIYHDPFGHEEIYAALSDDPMCTQEIILAIRRAVKIPVQEMVQEVENVILNHREKENDE